MFLKLARFRGVLYAREVAAKGHTVALTMHQKKAVTKEQAKRYARAGKREKSLILDEFVALTGYHRVHAARVLRQQPKPQMRKQTDRRRRKKYGPEELKALRKIWAVLGMPAGKRLAPYLAEIVPVMERCGELELDEPVRDKLLSISAATVDRMMAPERKRIQLKGRKGTKPGTLLKHQIPIRTFEGHDLAEPGFMEIDLVGHEGGNAQGDFAHTLDVTDVFSGWTETQAVRNKAQKWVFAALAMLLGRLPFEARGIDSDNGSEFINYHLIAFCREKQLAFTRSRPYRKNDNCFVEQKSWTVVRKTVGYFRYDTEEELRILNQIYAVLRLYTNYFQPQMRLVSKTRDGARVKKKYDTPKTPYRRLMESPAVGRKAKAAMKAEYEGLNPVQLKRKIIKLQGRLFTFNANKMNEARKEEKPQTVSATFFVRQ